MVRPRASAAVARMVELRGVQAGFRSTARSCCRTARRTRTICSTNQRRAGPAGAADAARSEGRRPDHDRRPAVHDSRRDRAGAGPPRRRLQPRLARARRLRRSEAHRPALVRQPRQLPDPAQGADEPAARRSRATCASDFRDQFVNVRSYRSTEDQIGEDLERAENYLSLVGFVIVVLGGIGVWSVTRVFVRQKIRSVAILKCVGATTRQVLATYVLQVVLLGAGGQPARRRARGGRRCRDSGVADGVVRRHLVRADRVGGAAGACASGCSCRCCSRSCRCSRSAASSRCC